MVKYGLLEIQQVIIMSEELALRVLFQVIISRNQVIIG